VGCQNDAPLNFLSNMKKTEKWLPIAEKKAQSELTFLRQQIRALDAFYSVNRLPEINQLRRNISGEIRMVRSSLRDERYKAVLRGDLSPEKYRPSPTQKPASAEVIPFEPTNTDAEQRELLLVS
jgi:hypothetical protein